MNNAQTRQADGTPGQEQPQVSAEEAAEGGSATTSLEDGGRIKIDPTKEYLMPDGKTSMLGVQVLSQMGRGALADEWQSKHDQATAKLQQLSTVAAERDAAFEQLAAIQRRQEMEQVIQERMPRSQAQPDEDLWDDNPTPSQPMNPQQMAQLVTELVEQKIAESGTRQAGDINSLIANQIREVMNQEQQNRAILERDKQWATNTRQARIDHYVNNLGLSEQDAVAIVDKVAASQALELEGRMAHAGGDQDAAHAAWQNATLLRDATVEDLAKAMIAKEESDRRADLEQQLETGQFKGIPMSEDDGIETEPNELWTNPIKALARRRQKAEAAAARHDAANQARNALGSTPG